jgi:Putative addiction module component
MTTTALKTNIKKQINSVKNETILRSIHAMLKEVLQDDAGESLLTKEQKKELDRTLAEHKSGKLKYYTVEQAKNIIYKKN